LAESPRAADLAGATLFSDSELVDLARQGDRRAFGTLYLRHHDAAWRVACAASGSRADAEDAVAEGFTKVFAALPRIVDRELAFRPYLLACVRNAAVDLHRRDRRIDLRDEMPEEHGAPEDEAEAPLFADLERNLVGEALKSLPERWRTVLWLTEVEGMTPTEVSSVIGIKPNAVAALSYRAREGLREAYLQAHLRAEAPAECRYTVDRLGPYVRGELADRERTRVQTHLDACAGCRQRRDELADVNSSLLGSLTPVPLVLGSRTQQEWLAGGLQRRGARRTRTPARAAKLADRDTAALTQRALAMVVALLLAVAGAVSLERFGDGDPEGRLDSVALPRQPFTAETPTAPGVTSPPGAPAADSELSALPPPAARSRSAVQQRSRPGTAVPGPAVVGAAPLPPAGESAPVTSPASGPASERASETPAPPPAPPAEQVTPPPPPQAASARASVGEGRNGAVVGAGVPDDGSPPEEPDVTVGDNQVSGDAPPPEGDEPPAETGGSAVPPEVSEAVATVGETIPVDQPTPDIGGDVGVPSQPPVEGSDSATGTGSDQDQSGSGPAAPTAELDNPQPEVEQLPAPERDGPARATFARVAPPT
jgi:RNA polymerase sigma factor (sigma-70 family)